MAAIDLPIDRYTALNVTSGGLQLAATAAANKRPKCAHLSWPLIEVIDALIDALQPVESRAVSPIES